MLPRIHRIALGMCHKLPASVEAADLAQAGALGMWTALRSFDPRRSDGLESYVTRRVRGAMLDELRALDPLTRDERRHAREISTAERELTSELGRTPELAEIAERTGLDEERILGLRGRAALALPLDAAVGVCDEAAVDPLERVALEELRAALISALADLTEREKTVMSLTLVEGLSSKEIGGLLGVTAARICQIHGSAVAKLRETFAPT